MAKKPVSETALTPTEINAARLLAHFDGADMPGWIDPAQHRMGEFGIYDIATGMLLDSEGLPQSAAARAMLRDQLAAELAAEAPAADAALADPQN